MSRVIGPREAVVFHGIGDIRLDDVKEPKIKEETDAIVALTTRRIKVKLEPATETSLAARICIGSSPHHSKHFKEC